MNAWGTAILAVVCVAFVAAVVGIIVNKLKHKSGCDCGGNCAMCAGCHAAYKKEEHTQGKK